MGVPGEVQPGMAQPGMAPGAARPDGARARPERLVPPGPHGAAKREPRRSGRRWGSLQGGLGVVIVIGSAAVGAGATIATGKAPGALLGLVLVVGTVVAALAVRPPAGWMIWPAPVLCYLLAALAAGMVTARPADSSRTARLIAAAQWTANGFFAMVAATALAIVLVAFRWLLQRRSADRRAAHRAQRPGEFGYDWADRGPLPPAQYPAPPRSARPPGPPGAGPYNFSSGA